MNIDREWPPVSVIMPMRDEAHFVERSVGAMLDQDYPGKLEVVCIDGMSEDGTRGIIEQMILRDGRLRLVDNPRRIIPAGLNIGVRAARHELIIRMDGHALAAPDYVRRCVETWSDTGAQNVGGQCTIVGDGYVSSAIAAAMGSRFGVGTARWRGGDQPGETDTVPFGLWERATVLALGGFDERLLVNQDYEFNYRLRAAGGRVYYSPTIRAEYHPRDNLAALARQYWRYGLWKARVVKMHPRSLNARHLIAPLFVDGLITGGLLSFVGPVWRGMYQVALAGYAALTGVFSLRQAAQHGWRLLPLVPVIFLILHIAWGLGFWIGVWRWWIMREDERTSVPG